MNGNRKTYELEIKLTAEQVLKEVGKVENIINETGKDIGKFSSKEQETFERLGSDMSEFKDNIARIESSLSQLDASGIQDLGNKFELLTNKINEAVTSLKLIDQLSKNGIDVSNFAEVSKVIKRASDEINGAGDIFKGNMERLKTIFSSNGIKFNLNTKDFINIKGERIDVEDVLDKSSFIEARTLIQSISNYIKSNPIDVTHMFKSFDDDMKSMYGDMKFIEKEFDAAYKKLYDIEQQDRNKRKPITIPLEVGIADSDGNIIPTDKLAQKISSQLSTIVNTVRNNLGSEDSNQKFTIALPVGIEKTAEEIIPDINTLIQQINSKVAEGTATNKISLPIELDFGNNAKIDSAALTKLFSETINLNSKNGTFNINPEGLATEATSEKIYDLLSGYISGGSVSNGVPNKTSNSVKVTPAENSVERANQRLAESTNSVSNLLELVTSKGKNGSDRSIYQAKYTGQSQLGRFINDTSRMLLANETFYDSRISAIEELLKVGTKEGKGEFTSDVSHNKNVMMEQLYQSNLWNGVHKMADGKLQSDFSPIERGKELKELQSYLSKILLNKNGVQNYDKLTKEVIESEVTSASAIKKNLRDYMALLIKERSKNRESLLLNGLDVTTDKNNNKGYRIRGAMPTINANKSGGSRATNYYSGAVTSIDDYYEKSLAQGKMIIEDAKIQAASYDAEIERLEKQKSIIQEINTLKADNANGQNNTRIKELEKEFQTQTYILQNAEKLNVLEKQRDKLLTKINKGETLSTEEAIQWVNVLSQIESLFVHIDDNSIESTIRELTTIQKNGKTLLDNNINLLRDVQKQVFTRANADIQNRIVPGSREIIRLITEASGDNQRTKDRTSVISEYMDEYSKKFGVTPITKDEDYKNAQRTIEENKEALKLTNMLYDATAGKGKKNDNMYYAERNYNIALHAANKQLEYRVELFRLLDPERANRLDLELNSERLADTEDSFSSLQSIQNSYSKAKTEAEQKYIQEQNQKYGLKNYTKGFEFTPQQWISSLEKNEQDAIRKVLERIAENYKENLPLKEIEKLINSTKSDLITTRKTINQNNNYQQDIISSIKAKFSKVDIQEKNITDDDIVNLINYYNSGKKTPNKRNSELIKLLESDNKGLNVVDTEQTLVSNYVKEQARKYVDISATLKNLTAARKQYNDLTIQRDNAQKSLNDILSQKGEIDKLKSNKKNSTANTAKINQYDENVKYYTQQIDLYNTKLEEAKQNVEALETANSNEAKQNEILKEQIISNVQSVFKSFGRDIDTSTLEKYFLYLNKQLGTTDPEIRNLYKELQEFDDVRLRSVDNSDYAKQMAGIYAKNQTYLETLDEDEKRITTELENQNELRNQALVRINKEVDAVEEGLKDQMKTRLEQTSATFWALDKQYRNNRDHELIIPDETYETKSGKHVNRQQEYDSAKRRYLNNKYTYAQMTSGDSKNTLGGTVVDALGNVYQLNNALIGTGSILENVTGKHQQIVELMTTEFQLTGKEIEAAYALSGETNEAYDNRKAAIKELRENNSITLAGRTIDMSSATPLDESGEYTYQNLARQFTGVLNNYNNISSNYKNETSEIKELLEIREFIVEQLASIYSMTREEVEALNDKNFASLQNNKYLKKSSKADTKKGIIHLDNVGVSRDLYQSHADLVSVSNGETPSMFLKDFNYEIKDISTLEDDKDKFSNYWDAFNTINQKLTEKAKSLDGGFNEFSLILSSIENENAKGLEQKLLNDLKQDYGLTEDIWSQIKRLIDLDEKITSDKTKLKDQNKLLDTMSLGDAYNQAESVFEQLTSGSNKLLTLSKKDYSYNMDKIADVVRKFINDPDSTGRYQINGKTFHIDRIKTALTGESKFGKIYSNDNIVNLETQEDCINAIKLAMEGLTAEEENQLLLLKSTADESKDLVSLMKNGRTIFLDKMVNGEVQKGQGREINLSKVVQTLKEKNNNYNPNLWKQFVDSLTTISIHNQLGDSDERLTEVESQISDFEAKLKTATIDYNKRPTKHNIEAVEIYTGELTDLREERRQLMKTAGITLHGDGIQDVIKQNQEEAKSIIQALENSSFGKEQIDRILSNLVVKDKYGNAAGGPRSPYLSSVIGNTSLYSRLTGKEIANQEEVLENTKDRLYANQKLTEDIEIINENGTKTLTTQVDLLGLIYQKKQQIANLDDKISNDEATLENIRSISPALYTVKQGKENINRNIGALNSQQDIVRSELRSLVQQWVSKDVNLSKVDSERIDKIKTRLTTNYPTDEDIKGEIINENIEKEISNIFSIISDAVKKSSMSYSEMIEQALKDGIISQDDLSKISKNEILSKIYSTKPDAYWGNNLSVTEIIKNAVKDGIINPQNESTIFRQELLDALDGIYNSSDTLDTDKIGSENIVKLFNLLDKKMQIDSAYNKELSKLDYLDIINSSMSSEKEITSHLQSITNNKVGSTLKENPGIVTSPDGKTNAFFTEDDFRIFDINDLSEKQLGVFSQLVSLKALKNNRDDVEELAIQVNKYEQELIKSIEQSTGKKVSKNDLKKLEDIFEMTYQEELRIANTAKSEIIADWKTRLEHLERANLGSTYFEALEERQTQKEANYMGISYNQWYAQKQNKTQEGIAKRNELVQRYSTEYGVDTDKVTESYVSSRLSLLTQKETELKKAKQSLDKTEIEELELLNRINNATFDSTEYALTHRASKETNRRNALISSILTRDNNRVAAAKMFDSWGVFDDILPQDHNVKVSGLDVSKDEELEKNKRILDIKENLKTKLQQNKELFKSAEKYQEEINKIQAQLLNYAGFNNDLDESYVEKEISDVVKDVAIKDSIKEFSIKKDNISDTLKVIINKLRIYNWDISKVIQSLSTNEQKVINDLKDVNWDEAAYVKAGGKVKNITNNARLLGYISQLNDTDLQSFKSSVLEKNGSTKHKIPNNIIEDAIKNMAKNNTLRQEEYLNQYINAISLDDDRKLLEDNLNELQVQKSIYDTTNTFKETAIKDSINNLSTKKDDITKTLQNLIRRLQSYNWDISRFIQSLSTNEQKIVNDLKSVNWDESAYVNAGGKTEDVTDSNRLLGYISQLNDVDLQTLKSSTLTPKGYVKKNIPTNIIEDAIKSIAKNNTLLQEQYIDEYLTAIVEDQFGNYFNPKNLSTLVENDTTKGANFDSGKAKSIIEQFDDFSYIIKENAEFFSIMEEISQHMDQNASSGLQKHYSDDYINNVQADVARGQLPLIDVNYKQSKYTELTNEIDSSEKSKKALELVSNNLFDFITKSANQMLDPNSTVPKGIEFSDLIYSKIKDMLSKSGIDLNSNKELSNTISGIITSILDDFNINLKSITTANRAELKKADFNSKLKEIVKDISGSLDEQIENIKNSRYYQTASYFANKKDFSIDDKDAYISDLKQRNSLYSINNGKYNKSYAILKDEESAYEQYYKVAKLKNEYDNADLETQHKILEELIAEEKVLKEQFVTKDTIEQLDLDIAIAEHEVALATRDQKQAEIDLAKAKLEEAKIARQDQNGDELFAAIKKREEFMSRNKDIADRIGYKERTDSTPLSKIEAAYVKANSNVPLNDKLVEIKANIEKEAKEEEQKAQQELSAATIKAVAERNKSINDLKKQYFLYAFDMESPETNNLRTILNQNGEEANDLTMAWRYSALTEEQAGVTEKIDRLTKTSHELADEYMSIVTSLATETDELKHMELETKLSNVFTSFKTIEAQLKELQTRAVGDLGLSLDSNGMVMTRINEKDFKENPEQFLTNSKAQAYYNSHYGITSASETSTNETQLNTVLDYLKAILDALQKGIVFQNGVPTSIGDSVVGETTTATTARSNKIAKIYDKDQIKSLLAEARQEEAELDKITGNLTQEQLDKSRELFLRIRNLESMLDEAEHEVVVASKPSTTLPSSTPVSSTPSQPIAPKYNFKNTLVGGSNLFIPGETRSTHGIPFDTSSNHVISEDRDIEINGNNIILDNTNANTRGFSGTMIGSLFGADKFSSPVDVFMRASGIYDTNEKAKDTPFTTAGKTLEPIIAQAVREGLNEFSDMVRPEDMGYTEESGKGNYYEGRTDLGNLIGEWDATSKNNATNPDAGWVMDFKTYIDDAEKPVKWLADNGTKAVAPLKYMWQLAHYGVLEGVDKAALVGTRLSTSNGISGSNDYENLDKITADNIKFMNDGSNGNVITNPNGNTVVVKFSVNEFFTKNLPSAIENLVAANPNLGMSSNIDDYYNGGTIRDAYKNFLNQFYDKTVKAGISPTLSDKDNGLVEALRLIIKDKTSTEPYYKQKGYSSTDNQLKHGLSETDAKSLYSSLKAIVDSENTNDKGIAVLPEGTDKESKDFYYNAYKNAEKLREELQAIEKLKNMTLDSSQIDSKGYLESMQSEVDKISNSNKNPYISDLSNLIFDKNAEIGQALEKVKAHEDAVKAETKALQDNADAQHEDNKAKTEEPEQTNDTPVVQAETKANREKAKSQQEVNKAKAGEPNNSEISSSKSVEETNEVLEKQGTQLGRLVEYWHEINEESIKNGKLVNENAAYFNTSSGQISSFVEGTNNHISQELLDSIYNNAKIAIDGAIHTHSDWSRAAFSAGDLIEAETAFKSIKKQIVASMDQVMTLDLNGVDGADFHDIIDSFIVKSEEAVNKQITLADANSAFGDVGNYLFDILGNHIKSIIGEGAFLNNINANALRTNLNKALSDESFLNPAALQTTLRDSSDLFSVIGNDNWDQFCDNLFDDVSKVFDEIIQDRFQKTLAELFNQKGLSSHLKLQSMNDWKKENPSIGNNFIPQMYSATSSDLSSEIHKFATVEIKGYRDSIQKLTYICDDLATSIGDILRVPYGNKVTKDAKVVNTFTGTKKDIANQLGINEDAFKTVISKGSQYGSNLDWVVQKDKNTGAITKTTQNLTRLDAFMQDIVIKANGVMPNMDEFAKQMGLLPEDAKLLMESFERVRSDLTKRGKLNISIPNIDKTNISTTQFGKNLKSIADNQNNHMEDSEISEYLYGNKEEFLEAAKMSGAGYAQGLEAAISESDEAAKNFCDSIVSTVRKELGIQSPSVLFELLGRYCVEGFVKGIHDEEATVKEAFLAVLKGAQVTPEELNNMLDRSPDHSNVVWKWAKDLYNTGALEEETPAITREEQKNAMLSSNNFVNGSLHKAIATLKSGSYNHDDLLQFEQEVEDLDELAIKLNYLEQDMIDSKAMQTSNLGKSNLITALNAILADKNASDESKEKAKEIGVSLGYFISTGIKQSVGIGIEQLVDSNTLNDFGKIKGKNPSKIAKGLSPSKIAKKQQEVRFNTAAFAGAHGLTVDLRNQMTDYDLTSAQKQIDSWEKRSSKESSNVYKLLNTDFSNLSFEDQARISNAKDDLSELLHPDADLSQIDNLTEKLYLVKTVLKEINSLEFLNNISNGVRDLLSFADNNVLDIEASIKKINDYESELNKNRGKLTGNVIQTNEDTIKDARLLVANAQNTRDEWFSNKTNITGQFEKLIKNPNALSLSYTSIDETEKLGDSAQEATTKFDILREHIIDAIQEADGSSISIKFRDSDRRLFGGAGNNLFEKVFEKIGYKRGMAGKNQNDYETMFKPGENIVASREDIRAIFEEVIREGNYENKVDEFNKNGKVIGVGSKARLDTTLPLPNYVRTTHTTSPTTGKQSAIVQYGRNASLGKFEVTPEQNVSGDITAPNVSIIDAEKQYDALIKKTVEVTNQLTQAQIELNAARRSGAGIDTAQKAVKDLEVEKEELIEIIGIFEEISHGKYNYNDFIQVVDQKTDVNKQRAATKEANAIQREENSKKQVQNNQISYSYKSLIKDAEDYFDLIQKKPEDRTKEEQAQFDRIDQAQKKINVDTEEYIELRRELAKYGDNEGLFAQNDPTKFDEWKQLKKSIASNVGIELDQDDATFNKAYSQVQRFLDLLMNGYHGSGSESYIVTTENQIISYIDKLEEKMRKGGKNTDVWKEKIENAIKELNSLQLNVDSLVGTDNVNNDKMSEVVGYRQQAKEIFDKINVPLEAEDKKADPTQFLKFANKVQDSLVKNSNMTRSMKFEYKDLVAQAKQFAKTGTGSIDDLKQMEESFLKTEQYMKEINRTGLSFFDKLKKAAWQRTINMLVRYFSIYDFIRYARNIISTVETLDTALVDLKKTFKGTNEELENFYYEASDIAKEMGVTTSSIIEQASAWSRLGYNSAEAATTMAKLSSQFASISPGMDTDTAQEGLVSMMKAWGLEVSDVKSVMDAVNTLGNNFAETNADIVDGMERSAAALSATGTSYQEALSLFTGAQEVLQNSETAGRALRSISLRLHGYSEDSEDDALETDSSLSTITGDLINLTKTAEHTQGISVFEKGSTDDFRSLIDYFVDLNDIWDEMSEKQQNDYLQKAFGKVQAQAGAALITNAKDIQAAMDAIEDSAGSADNEMGVIEDSIEYKLNA